MYQEILIQIIQRKLGKQQSVIEAIAVALDISYDAAHRRISMKSRFSIEETIRLAKTFEISLDHLFLDTETVLVKKTREIGSVKQTVSMAELPPRGAVIQPFFLLQI